ncbi:hypothetical protein [Thalassobacillus sp. C254]|uniref:hypothetical protein n=1 Tax=Thalassobacillus sp. C254 TaxID=1225341 RepID=UPI0006CF9FDA|nr:hypothetical protein [Thalassobacillus sp. C254]
MDLNQRINDLKDKISGSVFQKENEKMMKLEQENKRQAQNIENLQGEISRIKGFVPEIISTAKEGFDFFCIKEINREGKYRECVAVFTKDDNLYLKSDAGKDRNFIFEVKGNHLVPLQKYLIETIKRNIQDPGYEEMVLQVLEEKATELEVIEIEGEISFAGDSSNGRLQEVYQKKGYEVYFNEEKTEAFIQKHLQGTQE